MQKLLISFVFFRVCLCLLWIFLDLKAVFMRISTESWAPCSKFGLQNPFHLKLVLCCHPWLAGAVNSQVGYQVNRNLSVKDH